VHVVTGLAGSGTTVFLTTQYLEEADRLADRIAVLDGGRVVADGTAARLKEQVAGQCLDLVLADAAAFDEIGRRLDARAVRRDPGRLTLGVAFLIGSRPSAGPLDWLAAAGGFSFLVMFLPYPSSAFVPIDTMPIRPDPTGRPSTARRPRSGCGRLAWLG
jgi:hypothetical protein